MAIYSSSSDTDSDYQHSPPSTRLLLGRRGSPHTTLGHGTVAEVIMWRNKRISAAFLITMTVLWFLIEVLEYHFVTLVCHFSITAMLVIFICFNSAVLIGCKNPPNIPELILSESAFRKAASAFHTKLNLVFTTIHSVACGKDLKLFFLAMASLWMLSVAGTYFSTLNLVYIGFLCIATLPALYEHYQQEVDYMSSKCNQKVKKLYKKFDTKVLNKIPRGPVKDTRHYNI